MKDSSQDKKEKVLFLWIPKCAGTSIFNVLEKHGCRKLRERKDFTKFNNKGWVTFSHVDVNYLLKKNYLSQEYFDSAFKFCVVRNPWSRFVSLYKYKKFDSIMTFGEFTDFIDIKLQKQGSLLDTLAGPFYGSAITKDLYRFLNKQKITLPIPEIGPYNTIGLSQANNQADWVTDENGKIIADFVCRMETLEEDFSTVCEIIGINETLPHKNKSTNNSYKDYYTPETITKVGKMYQKDIELFGYEF